MKHATRCPLNALLFFNFFNQMVKAAIYGSLNDDLFGNLSLEIGHI